MRCFHFPLLISIATLGSVQDVQAQERRPPWHYVDAYWTCKPARSVQNISIDFAVQGDLTESPGIYVAPLGLINLGGVDFYGGVQTNTLGWPSKHDQAFIAIGKGGIFSRWPVKGGTVGLEYADGERGALYQKVANEDGAISVRHKLGWVSGRPYRFQVKRDRVGSIAGRRVTWYAANVADLLTGRSFPIGRLAVDGEGPAFNGTFVSFVEMYTGNLKDTPGFTVSYRRPEIDGVACDAASINAAYPKALPVTERPRDGPVVLKDGWYTISISALQPGYVRP